jgi:hypothetical protein
MSLVLASLLHNPGHNIKKKPQTASATEISISRRARRFENPRVNWTSGGLQCSKVLLHLLELILHRRQRLDLVHLAHVQRFACFLLLL